MYPLILEELIKQQDRENTLFYLDPPYYQAEKYYQIKFTPDDHIRLYNTLKNIKGKFILSYNYCNYIRELYTNYNIKEVNRFNNLSFKNKEFKELIITNY